MRITLSTILREITSVHADYVKQEMAFTQAVCNRVRTIRQERKLTQGALARLSGIHRPNIARLESGKHAPSLETLFRVATAMNCSVDTFFKDL